MDNMEKIGYCYPLKRNAFHLGDREKLINIVKEAGFEIEFCWNMVNAVNIFDIDEYFQMVTGVSSMKKPYESLTPEKQIELRKLIDNDLKKLKETHTPLSAEFIIIVARKPN